MCNQVSQINRQPRQLAYTLVQLLFVIAVGAAATVAAFSNINTNATIQKQNKAVIEMQYYMEAAIIYYGLNSKIFPSNVSQLQTAGLIPVIPTALGGNKNPWGNDYTFTKSSTEFTISTDARNVKNARAIGRRLPNPTYSGTTVSAKITATNKVEPPHDQMILVGIDRNVHLSKTLWYRRDSDPNADDYNTVARFYTVPSAKRNFVLEQCALYGRDAKHAVALTGFTIGSMMNGGYEGSLLNWYIPHNFRDIYVEPTGSSIWWADLHASMTHWDSGWSIDLYGEGMIFYYCTK